LPLFPSILASSQVLADLRSIRSSRMPAKKSASSHRATVAALTAMLADSYTLYLKTQNFHWNVTGPMFTTLHTLFEVQYTDLALAVDEIAERVRALHSPVPGSFAEFARIAQVRESVGKVSAKQMISTLVADQELLAAAARAVIAAAEKEGDAGSADLATRRLQTHDKNAWMLRSHLE
jgi:starvation-inducible DNA-binding protein